MQLVDNNFLFQYDYEKLLCVDCAQKEKLRNGSFIQTFTKEYGTKEKLCILYVPKEKLRNGNFIQTFTKEYGTKGMDSLH